MIITETRPCHPGVQKTPAVINHGSSNQKQLQSVTNDLNLYALRIAPFQNTLYDTVMKY